MTFTPMKNMCKHLTTTVFLALNFVLICLYLTELDIYSVTFSAAV